MTNGSHLYSLFNCLILTIKFVISEPDECLSNPCTAAPGGICDNLFEYYTCTYPEDPVNNGQLLAANCQDSKSDVCCFFWNLTTFFRSQMFAWYLEKCSKQYELTGRPRTTWRVAMLMFALVRALTISEKTICNMQNVAL